MQRRCYDCLGVRKDLVPFRRTQAWYRHVLRADSSEFLVPTPPNRTLWTSWRHQSISLRYTLRPKTLSISIQSSLCASYIALSRSANNLCESGRLCGSVLALNTSPDAPSGWLVLAAFFGLPTVLWAYKVSHTHV